MSAAPLVRRIEALLTPLGFKRRGRTWNRSAGRLVQVIDLQVSKAGDAVTVNAGVMDPDVYARCWGSSASIPVQEPDCTVRVRIGELIDTTDVWWPVGDSRTQEATANAVTEFVLPFLSGMQSKEAMAEFLCRKEVWRRRYPPPIMYLAILKNDLGDRAGACSLLNDLLGTASEPWRARIGEVLTLCSSGATE